MPVTSTLGTLANRLAAKFDRVFNEELAVHLGQELATDVVAEDFASGMKSQTGNTVDALSYVGQPERTATGLKIGVVGDRQRIGSSSDSGPKGTIRAFLDWYSEQKGLPQFFIRGGVPTPYAWRMLSETQKKVLQQERLSGRFGGESAAGVGRVPYMWGHEQGNASAAITQARHFIEKGLSRWRSRVSGLISEWYRARAGR